MNTKNGWSEWLGYFLKTLANEKMKFGYARVSTDDQDCALQVKALTETSCERIFEEKGTGARFDRPVLKECLSHLRPGDSLVVWRLDRLGRSTKDLIQTVMDLKGRGVQFTSLQEAINTETASGQLTFHLFAALAEFERNLIRERTMAGLGAARARGRVGGRPEKLTDRDRKKIKQLVDENKVPIKDIAKMFAVSRGSIYNSLKSQKE
jgi:DNA invertase Pin-like site-specific DNA recombinase